MPDLFDSLLKQDIGYSASCGIMGLELVLKMRMPRREEKLTFPFWTHETACRGRSSLPPEATLPLSLIN